MSRPEPCNCDQALELQKEVDRLTRAIALAIPGSCTCLTKTPDPYYHMKSCTYRKLVMAYNNKEEEHE